MKKAILLTSLFLCSCVNPQESRRTLSNAGYSKITLGGYAMWMCGGDDTFATEFTATNPVGKRVSGAVCCGIGKGCTIRH
jgi:hypothetical protein